MPDWILWMLGLACAAGLALGVWFNMRGGSLITGQSDRRR